MNYKSNSKTSFKVNLFLSPPNNNNFSFIIDVACPSLSQGVEPAIRDLKTNNLVYAVLSLYISSLLICYRSYSDHLFESVTPRIMFLIKVVVGVSLMLVIACYLNLSI